MIHRRRSSPQVDSINGSLKKIEAEEQRASVKPWTSMDELGAYAYSKDSEGNVIGLFEALAGWLPHRLRSDHRRTATGAGEDRPRSPSSMPRVFRSAVAGRPA